MWRSLQLLDKILRGEATSPARLANHRLDFPLRGLLGVLLLLGMSYGFCMGWFAVLNRAEPAYLQVLACMVKVPALFACTLLVTLPSLYVFNALVGSRFPLLMMVRLLVAALAVTLAVLASFGPIVAFFSVTTTNYPFMVLLNVCFFSISGFLGLAFLVKTLQRLALDLPLALPVSDDETVREAPDDSVGALEPLEGSVLARRDRLVFIIWILLFGIVGAQMGWVLRPFIGDPEVPFAWLRARESHFFEAIRTALLRLFS